ncbi:MAG: DUF4124 domain-containing protein [Burkholderiaceae bacterium]|nr:DUF4124 domain-containing protein [Burkholderiaceae bacterium]
MSARSLLLHRRVLPALLLGLLAAATLPVAAQGQWKWRDASGRIQYSDRPPPASVPERAILARPASPPTANLAPAAAEAPASAASASGPGRAGSAAPAGQDPELLARRRQAEAQEAARRRAEEDKLARQRQENCQRARDYLRTLDSGQRITRTNAQGEREFLDDAQRAAERRRAEEVIGSECR